MAMGRLGTMGSGSGLGRKLMRHIVLSSFFPSLFLRGRLWGGGWFWSCVGMGWLLIVVVA